ncbi:hypothetical protein OQA88_2904 [Cercophora sp. LCS_1]
MLFILRENHIGFPILYLTPDNMVAFIKTTLAIQVMYYANICCIKTSILVTYLRFAVSRTFRTLCYATIALHVVFFVICFVVTLAQCRPISKMWDFTNAIAGSCINTTAFFYFTSSFNIVTDLWILALPIPTLRNIQRPKREKIALFLIFGAGTFAATASIVRLYTIRIYTESTDPFRDGIPVNLWSIIEVTVAISCASVPALKPIFSRRQRAATRAAKSVSSGTSGMQYSGRVGYSQSQIGRSQPQIYSYEPPQTYLAREVRAEYEAEQTQEKKQVADLGFQPQNPFRPTVDREATESSGMSLGLPLQQPLQAPPRSAQHPPVPMPRSPSYRSDNGKVTSPTPLRGVLRAQNTPKTSLDAVRPAIPRRSSSQKSVVSFRDMPAGEKCENGVPHKRSGDEGWPLPVQGNGSQRSLHSVSARPKGPDRNASQGSFYLEGSD